MPAAFSQDQLLCTRLANVVFFIALAQPSVHGNNLCDDDVHVCRSHHEAEHQSSGDHNADQLSAGREQRSASAAGRRHRVGSAD